MSLRLQQSVARIAHTARRWYWRVFRPVTLGVCAIVLDASGKIILIKNSYRNGWHLPGGGVQRGETVVTAIKRELREEIDWNCTGEPCEILGVYSNFSEGNYDHVVVFVIRDGSAASAAAASLEIERIEHFHPHELPSDTGAGTRRRIGEFLAGTVTKLEW